MCTSFSPLFLGVRSLFADYLGRADTPGGTLHGSTGPPGDTSEWTQDGRGKDESEDSPTELPGDPEPHPDLLPEPFPPPRPVGVPVLCHVWEREPGAVEPRQKPPTLVLVKPLERPEGPPTALLKTRTEPPTEDRPEV